MDPIADIPGAQLLWQQANAGDPAIRIAIIDGPVDLRHQSLRGGQITMALRDTAQASSVKSEHGTHVASILMGVPSSSVVGLAPNCTATIYSIYNEGDDEGLLASSQATLALTINQALADGADVINISSGQLSSNGQAQRILIEAVRACSRAGKLIVAAAGNDGCRCEQVPASLESVLAVGGCDLNGRPLPFSNFGKAYLKNGILAPGKDVKVASPSQIVTFRSGTSFATPIVTGIVALLLSLLRKEGRNPDLHAVRAALLASASPCRLDEGSKDARCLIGVLNIPAAVNVLFADQEIRGRGLSPIRPHNEPWDTTFRGSILNGVPVPALEPKSGGSIMSELQSTASGPSSGILGPDGNALGTAAVRPVEASAPEYAAPPTAFKPSPGLTPSATVAPSQAAGMMWVPVSMAGQVVPAGLGSASGTVVPNVAPVAVAPAEATLPAVTRDQVPAGLRMSGEGCRCGVRPSEAQEAQLAFPIGQLYFDFGKEARLDYFVQAIAAWRDGLVNRGDPEFGVRRNKSADVAAPYSPEIMARYLLDIAEGEEKDPSPTNFRDANALVWTLTIDTTPIYAIKPFDVFGLAFYAQLVEALWLQEVSPKRPGEESKVNRKAETPVQSAEVFPPPGRITRVSFGGYIDPAATTRLLNGTVVPTLITDWRGFYQWDIFTLLGADPKSIPGAEGFLNRVYNEFRNVGISPQDRALNYSAMNALNTKQIFSTEATDPRLMGRLDTVEVEPSTICRPGSTCFDVTYRFFNPEAVLTRARRVYQFTIDPSDVIPVVVGKMRTWEVY